MIASNEQGVLQVGLSVAGEGVVQGDGLAAVLRFGLAPVADKGGLAPPFPRSLILASCHPSMSNCAADRDTPTRWP